MGTDPDGVGWSLRDDECPLEGALAFDRTTGEVAWRPTCKNARCRRCSRQVSAQTFALARRALEDSGQRVRFITLTQAPEGWEATRYAMHVWLQHLRRSGYSMHVLWVVEKGDDTGMKHIHAVQWGDYIPKEELSASWPHGFTQIEGARAATNYLAKGVVRYVAKGLDGADESIEDHMNLNGGRAAHWSREFFDGKGRNAYRQEHPLPGIYFVRTDMADRRASSTTVATVVDSPHGDNGRNPGEDPRSNSRDEPRSEQAGSPSARCPGEGRYVDGDRLRPRDHGSGRAEALRGHSGARGGSPRGGSRQGAEEGSEGREGVNDG